MHATHTVTIARPIEDVFAYVADGERNGEWRPGVVEIRRDSGDGGVGTRYTQKVRGPMGRSISADYEVTTFEPPRRLAFRTVTGPARPRGTYELAPAADGGTSVTFTLEAEMGGLGGLLLRRPVQRTMEEEVQMLENLHDRLEAEPGPTPHG